MLFYTIGQVHILLWMVGAGLAIGALYTLCALVRRLLCAGFWLTLFIDALFGFCAALVLIVAALTADYGRIRLYELLGAALGAILFDLGVRPLIEWLISWAARGIGRLFKIITNNRLIKVIFK